MANSKDTKKKTTSTSAAKKTVAKKTTKAAPKATTKPAAKKTTTKKVETKTTAKKTATKPATKKAAPKKVEVKEPVVKEVKKVNNKKKVDIMAWCKENYTIIGLVVLAILLIVNIVIVSVGHKAKLANGKEVIASINGKDFLAEDLFESLKESYGKDTLVNMIDEYIVDKEISNDEKVAAKETAQENIDKIKKQYESAGYEWETILTQYGYASEDALLKEMTLSVEKETIAKNYLKSELTNEDIKDYYNSNVFGKYTAKHILITPDTNDNMSDEEKAAAEETAKATAVEVINKLNNGEDWNTLVSQYSKDTGSSDNEGLIEDFTKGDVVDEFWNAVEGLKDGEYTAEPVKSSYGYHIIYRVSYTEKESLKKMKNKLVDEIVTKKLQEESNLYTTTWVKIRKKYKLEIKDSVVKSKYDNATNKSE